MVIRLLGYLVSLLSPAATAPASTSTLWRLQKCGETTIVYWGYIGIMEKKTTILGFRLLRPVVAFELYKVSESSGSMQGGWWADCELSLLQMSPLNPGDALQRDPYPKA